MRFTFISMNSFSRQERGRKNYKTGLWLEFLAMLFLFAKGYWPVARRQKAKQGEIDLIVRRGGCLVFVEIKKRGDMLSAGESVTMRQKARIFGAAEIFLAQNRKYAGFAPRFDCVLFSPYSWPRHIVNVGQF